MSEVDPIDPLTAAIDSAFADIPYRDADAVKGGIVAARARALHGVHGPTGDAWHMADMLIVGEVESTVVSGRQITLSRCALDGSELFFEYLPGTGDVSASGEANEGVDLGALFVTGVKLLTGFSETEHR